MIYMKCSRCKTTRTERWFQRPVSLCMLCYARIPGNEGLDLNELKEKAKQARSVSREVNRKTSRIALLTSLDATHDLIKGGLDAKDICDVCMHQLPNDDWPRHDEHCPHPECSLSSMTCEELHVSLKEKMHTSTEQRLIDENREAERIAQTLTPEERKRRQDAILKGG